MRATQKSPVAARGVSRCCVGICRQAFNNREDHADRQASFRERSIGWGAVAALAPWFPAWAQTVSPGIASTLPTVSGNDITLRIARQTMRIDGKTSRAIGINGTVPAPLVRLKEGQAARLTVVNDLDEDSSIHWHGLILPFHMDGVPGSASPGSDRSRPSSTNSPSSSRGPIGITAIQGCRSSLAITGRSSSTPRAPIRSATTASM